MKKAILSAFGVLLLLASCALPVNNRTETSGKIQVTLNYGEGERTIKPVLSFTVTHYDFIFTSASGQTITRTAWQTNTTTPIALDDVDVGQWKLTVNGVNDQSKILVQGTKDVTIKPGANALAVTLSVLPGKGDLSVRIKWPEGKLTNPAFEAALYKPNQTLPTMLTSTIDANLVAVDQSLDSGYYLLTTKLFEGADVAWGYTEAVIILAGETSSLVLDLDASRIKHAPEAPSNLAVRTYQGTTALLVWSDNSLVESEFELQKKVGTTGSWSTEKVLDFDVSEYKATVAEGSTYFYRVRSKNAWGTSAWSNEIQAKKPTETIVKASETISTTTLWSADTVHVIKKGDGGEADLLVTGQLSIAPGAVVLFDDGVSMVIGTQGSLVARGTTDQHIQFGSYSLTPTKGSWGNLWFNNDSKGAQYLADGGYTAGSALEYVDFSNGTAVQLANLPYIAHVSIKSFNQGPTMTWNNAPSNGMGGGGVWLGSTQMVIDDLTVIDTSQAGLSLQASNGYFYGGAGVGSQPVFNITVKNSSFTRAPKTSSMYAWTGSVTISNFSGENALRFEANLVEEGSQGVLVQGSGPKVLLLNNVIRNNSDVGLNLQNPNAGSIPVGTTDGAPLVQGNRIEGNQRGILLYGSFINSGPDASASDLTSYRFFQNTVLDNQQMGELRAGSAKVRFLGNRLTGNRGALLVSGTKATEFHSNAFDNKAASAEVQVISWDMAASNENLAARYNYWGSTDTQTIADRIRDKADDPESSIGLVTYQPYFSKAGQYLKAESPSSGGLITSYDITFTWSTFAPPAKTRFVLSDSADFANLLVDEKTALTKYLLTGTRREQLNPEKTYYWKILPVDSMGIEGEALTYQTFRTPKTGLEVKLGGTLDPELSLSGLKSVVYVDRAVPIELMANRTPDSVRWILNNQVLATGAASTYLLDTKALGLGRGAYSLTVEATVDGHPYTVRKDFQIDKIKATSLLAGGTLNFVELADGSWWTFGRATDWSDVQQMKAVGIVNGQNGTDGRAYATQWKDLAWVYAQDQFYLYLTKAGDLYAAGSNWSGRLGTGSSNNNWQYTPMLILSGVSKVRTSGYSTLALKADGTLWAWGENTQGVLGLGDTTNVNVPTQVNLSGVVDMTLNNRRAYAVLDDKTVYGWGTQQNGEFGPFAISNQYLKPKALTILQGAVSVEGRQDWEGTALFLMDDGSVKGMGYTNTGLFANGQQWAQANQPLTLPLPPIKSLHLVRGTAYAVTADDSAKLYAWGDNGQGQVGIDSTDGTVTTPKLVLSGVKLLSPGPAHVLVTDLKDNVYGWGGSFYGGAVLPGVTNSRLASQLNW